MSFTLKDININYVISFMNYRYDTNEIITIDNIEVSMCMQHNGISLPTFTSKNNSFIPWGLTEEYYNDVVLSVIVPLVRNGKIDDILKKS